MTTPSTSLHGGAVTIGNFDGVHRGHQVILQQLCAAADRSGGPSVVVTFDPHPAQFFAPAQQLGLLSTPEDKQALLQHHGVDHVVTLPFTAQLAAQRAEDFLTEHIFHALRPQALVVGYDLTFGHRREGTVEYLAQQCDAQNIYCEKIDPIFVDDILVSSSYVRRCIRHAEMPAATQACGRPHWVPGTVASGHGIGRTLGFPTINMQPASVLLPPNGSYVSRISWDAEHATWHPAATYLGTRPSFDGDSFAIETFVLNATPPENITQCAVQFIEVLRGEKRFADHTALMAAIQSDVDRAQAVHQAETQYG